MPAEQIHYHPMALRCFAISLVVAACCGICRGGQNSSAVGRGSSAQDQVRLTGCLGGNLGQFRLSSADPPGTFVLTGQVSGLEKYSDREIIVEGNEGDPIEVQGFSNPFPSFNVARLVEVVEQKEPALSSSFTTTANWHAVRIAKYGVQFSRPTEMAFDLASGPPPDSNFVVEKDSETVSIANIPREIYSETNFQGGLLFISVNRHMDRPSCMQFGQLGPGDVPPSPVVVDKVQYAEMKGGGAAMGTWESDYYFHTFQNGLCYEVGYELTEFSARTADSGCNVPLLSAADEWKLIQPLISKVSFFRPTPTREKSRYR